MRISADSFFGLTTASLGTASVSLEEVEEGEEEVEEVEEEEEDILAVHSFQG